MGVRLELFFNVGAGKIFRVLCQVHRVAQVPVKVDNSGHYEFSAQVDYRHSGWWLEVGRGPYPLDATVDDHHGSVRQRLQAGSIDQRKTPDDFGFGPGAGDEQEGPNQYLFAKHSARDPARALKYTRRPRRIEHATRTESRQVAGRFAWSPASLFDPIDHLFRERGAHHSVPAHCRDGQDIFARKALGLALKAKRIADAMAASTCEGAASLRQFDRCGNIDAQTQVRRNSRPMSRYRTLPQPWWLYPAHQSHR